MEEFERRSRRKYYQEKFAQRPGLYYASLLFFLFQIMKLIRIFTDAASAKSENLALPANYSVGGVVGALLTILLSGFIALTLFRQRRGLSRIRPGRRYLLIDALLLAYGLVRVVNRLIAVFDFFMVLYLLDLLAAATALCVPTIALWWADRERIPPEDLLLLLCGGGAAGFSFLAIIILAISIGKDYTVLQVIPELALRVGILLCGLVELRAALLLRAEAPIAAPVEKSKPEKPEKAKKPKRELHIKLFDNLPGYDDEEPEAYDDEDDGIDADADARNEAEDGADYGAQDAGYGGNAAGSAGYGARDAENDTDDADTGVSLDEYLATHGHTRRTGNAAGGAGYGTRNIENEADEDAFLYGAAGESDADAGVSLDEYLAAHARTRRAGNAASGAGYGGSAASSANYGARSAGYGGNAVDDAPGRASAPRRPGSALERAGVRPARMPEGADQPNRVTCPDCGRRFPAVLGTCPYCGRFFGDE